jgi:aminoglycoside phosphotransferase (APT) family kinase protein
VSATTDHADLAARLASVLGAHEITGLVRLSGGASRETWRFEADGTALVVQRQRAGSTHDMALEAAVLRAVHAAGVPVARILAAGTGDDGVAYIVSEAVDGETIARKILRDGAFATARAQLTSQLGAALARLHAVDPRQLRGLPAGDQLWQYRDVLVASGQPHPAFELAIRWLESHRPEPRPPVLVHGDFRLGNVIVGPAGMRAVVDWELAHLGDPMEDLGWLCVKAWRFGSPKPVAGVGERAELFAAYEAAGGGAVDPDVAHWWEVFGTLRWGIMCIMQAEAHRSGTVRSHELAAIGRRVCENEHDLFLALEGRW